MRCIFFVSVDLSYGEDSVSPLYTQLAVRIHLMTVVPRTLKRHYLHIPHYPALFVGSGYLGHSTLQCMEGYNDLPMCCGLGFKQESWLMYSTACH